MSIHLTTFLSKFKELTPDERNELARLLVTKKVAKGDVLVKQGEHCSLCFFVLKGCMRQFLIEDGIDKTVGIYTEEQAINYYNESNINTPADSFLMALEDSEVLVGNPEMDAPLYAKFPALVNITRKMIESDLIKAKQDLSTFITSSPEQRYLHLLSTRPELLQRVQQTVIASYLGITPESLSRIRKRIQKKE